MLTVLLFRSRFNSRIHRVNEFFSVFGWRDSDSPLVRQQLSRLAEGGQKKSIVQMRASSSVCLFFFPPFHNTVHARMSWQTSLECSLLMSPPGCLFTRRTHEFAPSAFTVVTHVGGEREHQRDKHLPAAESGVSASLTAIHLHSSQYLGPVLPVMKSCNSWGGNWWPICLTLSSCQMLLPPSYWLIILLLFPAVSSTKLLKHL